MKVTTKGDDPPMTALQVAQYFLQRAAKDEGGEPMSHLKLQKLCYYAQGFHLAIYGRPLFRDTILAWQHGPVVRSVWDEFKQFGGGVIPVSQDQDFSNVPEELKELLDEVYEVYGQFSAWKLRNMTHEEPPWQEAYATKSFISDDHMAKYFSTLVDAGSQTEA